MCAFDAYMPKGALNMTSIVGGTYCEGTKVKARSDKEKGQLRVGKIPLMCFLKCQPVFGEPTLSPHLIS